MSQGSHDSHGMGKHMLMMALCCLIPIALLGIIWFTGFKSATLSALIPLLCPILMIVCMGMMFMHGKNDNKTASAPADQKGAEDHQGHSDK